MDENKARRFRVVSPGSQFCGMVFNYCYDTPRSSGVVLQGTMFGAPKMWFSLESVEEVSQDASSVLRLRD